MTKIVESHSIKKEMNLKNIDRVKQLLQIREDLTASLRYVSCNPDGVNINGKSVCSGYRTRLKEVIENELKKYISEIDEELRSL